MTDLNANRPGYKKTKVGWIPEEWEVATIGRLTDSYSGGTPSRGNNSYFSGEIPWIKSGELNQGLISSTDEFISQSGLENSSAKMVEPNTLLYALYGATAGVPAITLIEATINQAILAIKPKKSLDNKFLFFWLQSSRQKLVNKFTQGGQPNFSGALVKSFIFPVPPLEEQEKIAEILDVWDRAIKQTRQLIDAKRRLKKGLMQQLLTGRMRFPGFGPAVEKAGELPEGWEEKTLGEIGTFSKGANIQKSDLVENGIPCIRYGEIYTVHDFILNEFKSYISPATAQSSKRIYKGDILFAGSGETREEIGKCIAYVDEYEAYAGGDVIIFRSKENNPYYFGYLLNHPWIIRQKAALGQGYSIFHIYPSMLKKLIIHLPPKYEQERIVQALSILEKEIQRLVTFTKSLNQQKIGLLRKLMTGEIRV